MKELIISSLALVFIFLVIIFLFSFFRDEDYARGCESLGFTAEEAIPFMGLYDCREIIETEKTFTDRLVPLRQVNGVWKEKVKSLDSKEVQK